MLGSEPCRKRNCQVYVFCVYVFRNPPLDIKKIIVLLHTLSAYNSLLVRCKVYSSDPRECLCTKVEGMVKPMKTLVMIQHHGRELRRNKTVTAKVCLVISLLLGTNYAKIKA